MGHRIFERSTTYAFDPVAGKSVPVPGSIWTNGQNTVRITHQPNGNWAVSTPMVIGGCKTFYQPIEAFAFGRRLHTVIHDQKRQGFLWNTPIGRELMKTRRIAA